MLSVGLSVRLLSETGESFRTPFSKSFLISLDDMFCDKIKDNSYADAFMGRIAYMLPDQESEPPSCCRVLTSPLRPAYMCDGIWTTLYHRLAPMKGKVVMHDPPLQPSLVSSVSPESAFHSQSVSVYIQL